MFKMQFLRSLLSGVGFRDCAVNCLLRRALCRRCYSSSGSVARRTCLFNFHKRHDGKIVSFAGWEMPVVYKDLSIVDSTIHTRNHVSIFDVSHMLQTKIFGKQRVSFFESLITGDVEGLSEDQGTLSVFTNDEGGIKDDLIVTKTSGDHLYVVTNAGCIDKDLPHMTEQAKHWRSYKGADVAVEPQDGRGLIAVQGPEMTKAVQPGLERVDLSQLYFMHSAVGTVFGIPDCRITRCGYTGEDGVEISVPGDRASELCEKLLESADASVKLAGLGARDACRLEAGLCLYGNDIDETTTPAEAGLLFVVAKRRRETAGFPGADKILKEIKDKSASRKRVGIISEKGRPPRGGSAILNSSGEVIGKVTSGCPSPCLKKNVAMGYVTTAWSKLGTKVEIDVSGKKDKLVQGEIVKMPFVPTHYHTSRSPKS